LAYEEPACNIGFVFVVLFVFDYFFSFFNSNCSWHNNTINKHIVKLYSCCYTAIQKGIYTPNLEALDASPRFALDTFNTGTVTQKGAVANAKIFSAVRQLGTPENQQEINHVAETNFLKASSDSLGMQLAQASGVKMTQKEQKTYGHAMTKIRDVVIKLNPTLANNMAYYTMGRGKNQFTSLMNDEKFTTQTVKNMESQETSAWLANTLNMKQTETSTLTNIATIKPNKFTDDGSPSVNNPTLNQHISSKQPKSKPMDLVDLQKRDFEGDKQWG
jgi:hypothetical protein